MRLLKKKKKGIVIHIDFPTKLPGTTIFKIQGWIVSNAPVDFIGIGSLNFDLVRRPDVEAAYPSFNFIHGFQGIVGLDVLRNCTLVFKYSIQGKVIEHIHTLSPNPMLELSKKEKFEKLLSVFPDEKPEYLLKIAAELEVIKDKSERQIQKLEKLKKILPWLICPKCKQNLKLTSIPKRKFVCEQCYANYIVEENKINFITKEIKATFRLEDTENIAARSHDPLALSLIGKYKNGLILDCGAGYPYQEYRNVINFEIVNYPSTDVLGVGEKLPFEDHTFDALFSFSVLEHVKDPFLCAKEIIRVLKPNGTLYCSVPFLQPLHAYPHHYYNMTSLGLQNLFSENIAIMQTGIPISGEPLFTLNWIIENWSSNLEGDVKERFLDLSFRDLLKDPEQYIQEPFVTTLPKATKHELACTTMILGKKVIQKS